MSSSEDEFFDAPENLGLSLNKGLWDDDDDDLEETFNALERSCNNEERRNRVEILKHSSLQSSGSASHHLREQPPLLDGNNRRPTKHQSLSGQTSKTSHLLFQTPQNNLAVGLPSSGAFKSRTCEAWLKECSYPETESVHPVNVVGSVTSQVNTSSPSEPESHAHLESTAHVTVDHLVSLEENNSLSPNEHNSPATPSNANSTSTGRHFPRPGFPWRNSTAARNESSERAYSPTDVTTSVQANANSSMPTTRQMPWNWALSRLGAAADRARHSAVATSILSPSRESMRPAVARCPPSTPQDATSHLVEELLPSLVATVTTSSTGGELDASFLRPGYLSAASEPTSPSEISVPLPGSLPTPISMVTFGHSQSSVLSPQTGQSVSRTLQSSPSLPRQPPGHTQGSATLTGVPPNTVRRATDTILGNESTLVRGVSHASATLDPLEVRYRQRTMSNSSLTHSEDSEGGKESVSGQPGLFGSLFKRFQRSVHSALPKSKGDESDEDIQLSHGVRVRSARNMRNKRDFIHIRLVQEMRQEHTGAIWAMRFSPCGRLLATAGDDLSVRIWTLKQYYRFFKAMQTVEKPSQSAGANGSSSGTTSGTTNSSATFSHNHLYMRDRLAQQDEEILLDSVSMASTSASTMRTEECSTCSSADEEEDLEHSRGGCFRSRPLLTLRGHEATVTELVWSRNLFLLSASMDKQVRLWHVSRRDTLCIFSHRDTVPGICFHPKDDRFFLSGSMDAMLRLWYIPDKRVHSSVEVPPVPSLLTANFATTFGIVEVGGGGGGGTAGSVVGGAAGGGGGGGSSSGNSLPEQRTIITCVAFTQEGAKIVVGTYDGRVMFFTTDLSYITSISFKPYHGKIRHCKVNGIEPDPTDANKILVTTSDSRARLVDSRDYHTVIKYRGMDIRHTRIRATFSSTGGYIISGSENNQIYIWKKEHDVSSRLSRLSTTRKDRNGFWEAIRSHDDVVTCALFSPCPNLILDRHLRKRAVSVNDTWKRRDYYGEVIVSADCSGCIKVYKNRLHKQPQQSQSQQR